MLFRIWECNQQDRLLFESSYSICKTVQDCATDEKWTENGTGRTSIERPIRDGIRISISPQHKNSLSSKNPIRYCKLKKSYEPALQDRAHLAPKIGLIFHVDRLSRRYQRHSQDAISFDWLPCSILLYRKPRSSSIPFLHAKLFRQSNSVHSESFGEEA